MIAMSSKVQCVFMADKLCSFVKLCTIDEGMHTLLYSYVATCIKTSSPIVQPYPQGYHEVIPRLLVFLKDTCLKGFGN